MKVNPIAIVLCLGALPLVGCGNQLTTQQAEQVVANALAQRRASGMANPTEGRIDLQVGALRGSSADDHCTTSTNQPVELADMQMYDRAQIIHLDRPEPCKWVVTLSPQAQRDVPYDDTFKPPTPRDYNAVSISLSQWASFEVGSIHQQGMTAQVEVVFHYRFTDTMRQLARANIFPHLKPGCLYETRDAQIQCTRALSMSFAGTAWQVDLSPIDEN